MSAGGSVFVPRDASTPKKPRRFGSGRGPHGPNLIEIAEAVLFPGIDATALTHAQQAEAVRMARAHLVEIGQWPESVGERQERTKAAERYAARKADNDRARAEVRS